MQIVMKTDLKKTGDIQSTKTLPQGRRGKITACLFMWNTQTELKITHIYNTTVKIYI